MKKNTLAVIFAVFAVTALHSASGFADDQAQTAVTGAESAQTVTLTDDQTQETTEVSPEDALDSAKPGTHLVCKKGCPEKVCIVLHTFCHRVPNKVEDALESQDSDFTQAADTSATNADDSISAGPRCRDQIIPRPGCVGPR